MNVLKQWSNKNTFNILFDSKVNGDGSNNVLYDSVFNRINLYFITFDDDNNNVFNGYVNTKIGISDEIIGDHDSFVFSLIRNNKVRNKKYIINSDLFNYDYKYHDFYLFNIMKKENYINLVLIFV